MDDGNKKILSIGSQSWRENCKEEIPSMVLKRPLFLLAAEMTDKVSWGDVSGSFILDSKKLPSSPESKKHPEANNHGRAAGRAISDPTNYAPVFRSFFVRETKPETMTVCMVTIKNMYVRL